MTVKIRRPENASERQMQLLKEIRQEYDPNWIQSFSTGDFSVAFDNNDSQIHEVEKLAESCGYVLKFSMESTDETDYFFGQ